MSAAGAPGPCHSDPALDKMLDKVLDILELPGGRSGGLSPAASADAVGPSVSQVFRVLQTLESRGISSARSSRGITDIVLPIFGRAQRPGRIQLRSANSSRIAASSRSTVACAAACRCAAVPSSLDASM